MNERQSPPEMGLVILPKAERMDSLRYFIRLSATLFTVLTLTGLATGQAPNQMATTTVTANPTAVTVGASVALTATVQPNDASINPGQAFAKPTGTIIFLDGSTPLGSTPVALATNTFASAAFQQIFGTPSAKLTQQNVEGGLTGDLNGDGINDLLVYTYTNSSLTFYAQAFISDGKGGYSAATLQTPGFSGVTNIPALIDLNGDGKLDLLDGTQVAYGNGDGTFAQAVPVSFLSSGFEASYAADIDGDGKTDIIAVNSISGSLGPGPFQAEVTVFLNGGGGSFTTAGTFPITPPFTGSFDSILIPPLAFADLNGDGKIDMVAQTQTTPLGNAGGQTYVAALLNTGGGTFGAPMQVTVPYPPNNLGITSTYYVGFGDLNGDEEQDLILTLYDQAEDQTAIIFLGNGDGTFEAPSYLALPTKSGALPNFVVQDVNLDGHLDLVFGGGTLALGKGDGTFTFGTPLFSPPPLTGAPYSILQISLPGNPVSSIVFLVLPATPPAAAVFTPQTSSSAALSSATLAVGMHTITAQYSGDANYSADTSPAVAVTVNQAVSATAATSSINPSFAGQSVTLTANVTSNGPTPTGNVTFTSGSTTLTTVALSGGSAAYSTTSFTTVGTQAITASYSGDANTQASSATLSQIVAAAFALAPGSTTLTVQSGQTVSAPINVTGAAGFSGQVTFACSGLPANASCSFSPATITVSGTPAVPTSLSVNTAASTTAGQVHAVEGLSTIAFSLGLGSLVLFWPVQRRRTHFWTTLGCLFVLTIVVTTGCGSGGSTGGGSGGSGNPVAPPATAPGTYSFMVTATSGNVQTKSTYMLIVQ